MKKSFLLLIFLVFIQNLLAKDSQEITDMIARKVIIPEKIERIVTVGSVPVINALLMSIGQGQKIVSGLPAWAKKALGEYQYYFAPNLKDNLVVQKGGTDIDIEKIIELKPDVVFVMTFYASLADILAPKGIKVVVLKWDSAADVRPTMELLAKIFHDDKGPKAYVKYFEDTLKKVEKITKNIKEEDKIRVLYTRFYNMTQPVLIAEWWIKMAGGKSVTAGKRDFNSLAYDSEALLAWNPELIITTTARGLKMLRADKKFANIKALKNHQCFVAPRAVMSWGQPSVEQPLMVLWALNRFYPGLYPREKLAKDVGYFYESFFGKKLSKERIAKIID